MLSRPRLLVVAGLVVLAIAGVIVGPGLWDRVYYGSQGLDVGPPTKTWSVSEAPPGSYAGVRVAVVGDPGTGGAGELAVTRVIAGQHDDSGYDALVLLGDLVYPDGDPDLIGEAILDPFAPLLGDSVELLPALGNHDYQSGQESQILQRLGRDSGWFAQEVGPALVVVLDSNRVDDPVQTQWLRQTLDGATSPWMIAAMHHPAYSAGMHGSDLDVRSAWSDLFAEYGVDLVLAGHDHDYQRSEVMDGVTYVVSGGGAKTRPTGTDGFTAFSASTLHYLDLQITDDQLLGQAIDTDGHAFDTFALTSH